MISSNALRKWIIPPTNCYASSNTATDLSASRIVPELNAIRFHGLSTEICGVKNGGFVELSSKILQYNPTTRKWNVLLKVLIVIHLQGCCWSLSIRSDPTSTHSGFAHELCRTQTMLSGRADCCLFRECSLSPIAPERLWARKAS